MYGNYTLSIATYVSKKSEVNVLSSIYHIEVDVTSFTNQRQVIQDIVKQVACLPPITQNYRIIVIHDADHLANDAQQSLRRTMEKYMSTCRFILSCSSLTHIMDPIRSRTLPIRIAAPDIPTITSILNEIGNQTNTLSPRIHTIATGCNRNLYDAITRMQKPVMDYETAIDELCQLVKDKKPMDVIRNKCYEIHVQCIDAHKMLEEIVDRLFDLFGFKSIYEWASEYDVRMRASKRPILHLEAFLARVIFTTSPTTS